ncbi:MAG TPA: xylulokinase [Aggregatilineales bacterium]|nr:xylulokinase [Aggregatilineales bacterium]
MMTTLLGVDVGTSSVKVMQFDPELGRPLAAVGEEYPIHTPQPGWAEQDPEDYWSATVRAVRAVIAQTGRTDVVGISFSGQMHGTILLDSSLRPLARAIIWADTRSSSQVHQLVESVPDYAAQAGTLPAAGFLISTMTWLQQHQPDLIAKTYRVILPKDYVRLKMTGEAATDVSDAAGTGTYDVGQGRWAEAIIKAANLPLEIFPPVKDSVALAGHLQAGSAAELGLAADIPVFMGCADQPAQAIGNGLIQPGAASVTVGTGGQVCVPLIASGNLRTDQRLHVFNHAVPGMHYVLGAILSAGLSLRWLRNLVGLQGVPDAYAILSAEAAAVPPGAEGLIFLPHLTGERTPHMDPLARGLFLGLGYHHGRGHLARAVMEGVSLALRQVLELSLELSGPVDRVIASGGGMESDFWRQIMADVLNLPLQRSLMAEQASLGAALVAGVGAGIYPSFESACASLVRYGPPTEPRPGLVAFYDDLYAQYTRLYPLLRPEMHQLVERRSVN